MSNKYPFFAFIGRMKLIGRWPLMYNTRQENVQEHSHQVSTIAHALGLIRNRVFPELGLVNADYLSTVANFHDAEEILTGDPPTPTKYFSPEMKKAYDELAEHARGKLVSMLPDAFQEDYQQIFDDNQSGSKVKSFVKAADTIASYLKCLEELRAGNNEFMKSKKDLEKIISESSMPEVKYFMEHFTLACSMTFDQLAAFTIKTNGNVANP